MCYALTWYCGRRTASAVAVWRLTAVPVMRMRPPARFLLAIWECIGYED